MAEKQSYSDTTVMLIGIAAMLLAAAIYVGFGFAADCRVNKWAIPFWPPILWP